ncbi:MAG: hypothetical protein KDA65_15135, partial [Planctomycetaceae bacterium]|nr:hypothetical protein [Planctomycetaceae bacterium]
MLQNRTISSRYLFFSTLLFMLIAVLGIRIVLAEENRLEAVKTDPPTAAEQVKDLWKTRKKKLQSCYFEWEREKVMSYSYLELREMQQRTTLDGGRISDEMIKLIRESYADQKVTEKQTHKLWLKGDKFRYEIEGTTIGGLKDREPHPTEVYQVYDGTVFFSFSYNPTWSPYTNAYFKKPNDHCFRYYGVEFLQDYLQIFPQEERFQQYADYRLAQQDVREETLTFNLYQYLPGEKRSVNPQFPPELRLDLERGGLILARKSFHYQGKIREQSKCEYSRD